MEPTEEENGAMYHVTDEYWQKTGAVHGRWRAIPVPREQIEAADQELTAGLQRALGPDRYVDYQMATSDTGQQMNNLASRYDLPRETIREGFSRRPNSISLIKQISRSGLSADNTSQARRVELEEKIQQALGPVIWQAWLDGRNQNYNIEP